MNAEQHFSLQGHKQNDYLIRRRIVFDQSNKMKTIEGRYQLTKNQCRDVVQEQRDSCVKCRRKVKQS